MLGFGEFGIFIRYKKECKPTYKFKISLAGQSEKTGSIELRFVSPTIW
jgi:hypothetical protein